MSNLENSGAHRFIQRLRKLVDDDDRGALSSLRRSLQDPSGMAAAACPYVVPFLRKDASLSDDRAYFLIGALFALHREHADGVTLGEAFRRLSAASSGDGGESPSVRARFVALLDAHPDDLSEHLRTALSLLKAKEVALSWELLLRDVLMFHHPERIVQRRWARHFWASNESEETPTTEVTQ